MKSCNGATSLQIFDSHLRRNKTIGQQLTLAQFRFRLIDKAVFFNRRKSGIIKAKGLSTRNLRLRSSATDQHGRVPQANETNAQSFDGDDFAFG